MHFAAHSHHLWPDAARAAQLQVFDDAARLADDKWDHVFSVVWPAAQAHVASELNLPDPSSVVFAPNTHQLLVTLFSAIEKKHIRLLTTDGEFHSLKRQSDRWVESGRVVRDTVSVEPAETFDERFLAAARTGDYDVIFTSQVFFNSGQIIGMIDELADLAAPDGPFVVIDGYHGFMAVPTDLSGVADKVFYVGGGYKYAMAGEGCAFLHAPAGFAPRPEITGWYAAFGDLVAPPGGVGYTEDAMRLVGATFDPSGLYRFNAVRDMLTAEGLMTEDVSAHVFALQKQLWAAIQEGHAGALQEARLLNPLGETPGARFLALEHKDAQAWQQALHGAGIITDVRGDVLRIGLGLYHDAEDIEIFCKKAAACL
jgi:selenocysteine lyase/cysteine desulfurase